MREDANLLTMGVDIGSASSKVVILRDGAEILAGVAVPVGTGTTACQSLTAGSEIVGRTR